MSKERETHIKDLERLRKQRLIARDALFAAGKEEFKRESSAKWADFSVDDKGRMLASVQHDDVKGCTPKMIQWFLNI